MTAMSQLSEEDAKLASQCLDICQTLAGKSLPFSFSFNIGPNFSFSVDTRGKEVSTLQKKKKTPSTLRRDARRSEEFLNKKPNAPTAEKTLKCDQCDGTFKSENGLKIHIRKAHKTPKPKERLRQNPGSPATMPPSPLLDASREEVAEVVMVEPTPPRLPPSSRTSSEESDTSSPLELPSACPGIFTEVGGGETGCGYCGRGWGKKCDWPWLKKQFRMTKEGLKAIEDD